MLPLPWGVGYFGTEARDLRPCSDRESGRGCREVVLQISAAGRALDQTGFKILASGLRHCLQDEQAAEHAGHGQAELEKLFLQLR